jgi:curved DNA-binding protein CbpA
MTDFFALLDFERRPWLGEDALKARFHELSAQHHPDAGGEDAAFAAINRGYQTLVDPALRLKHLLELETQETVPRTQGVPDIAEKYFAPVAEVTRAADAFFKKHAASNSPITKAILSTQQFKIQEEVERLIAELQGMQDATLEKVKAADEAWNSHRAEAVAALPELWQALGYSSKWLASLREILFRFASI